jgi:hypothetical protein
MHDKISKDIIVEGDVTNNVTVTQLDTTWVLSKPSPGMTDLLGHAVGQTGLNLAILAHVVCGRQLEALWVNN